LGAGPYSLAEAGKASAVTLAVLAQVAAATAVLTGLLDFGLCLLLGVDTRRLFYGAVRRISKDWVPRWGLVGWVRVHLLTVPANPRLKSKMFVKSGRLFVSGANWSGDFVHFLQKFVNREPAALRHQAGAGRQQANHPWWVQALGPQPG